MVIVVVVVVVRWRLIFLEFPVLVCKMYGEFRDENTSKLKVACVSCRDR